MVIRLYSLKLTRMSAMKILNYEMLVLQECFYFFQRVSMLGHSS